jgi:hypothetical protein
MREMDFGQRLKRKVETQLGTAPSRIFLEETSRVFVATFVDTPASGLDTSITVGLSAHVLDQEASGRPIRQELMSSVDRKYGELPWHEVLPSAGKIVLGRHTAFKLVLGPAGPLFSEAPWCKATALLDLERN